MHVAIIMDGNGRWAKQRGLVRSAGHGAGAKAAREIIRAAAELGIDTLTLYAFSSDNWSRPRSEVENLMALFRRTLVKECKRCIEAGISVTVIGRRDRLDRKLLEIIDCTERATGNGRRMRLRIAVDYSSRHAIASEISRKRACLKDNGDAEAFGAGCGKVASGLLDVDLLIRTGGEYRLSDFMLWECAYAELVFIDTLWPDFDEEGFRASIRVFENRERRFGGIAPKAPANHVCDAR